MLKRISAFWQGRVLFVAQGKELARFINELRRDRVNLYRTRQTRMGLKAQVTIRDFFRLRRSARLTHTRIHIVAKYGLPFIMARWRRRKGLIAGIGIILIGLTVISQFVLSIGVNGNISIEKSVILEKARELGLETGALNSGLDYGQIGEALQKQIPEAAWIGVEKSGTHVEISVVEKKRPEVPEGAGNLVANRTGLVEDIMVIQGTVQVHSGEMVRPGQILITALPQPPAPAQPSSGNRADSKSGTGTPKPDDSPEAKAYASAAKGFVRGRVWYSAEIKVPLSEDKLVETGTTAEGWGIKIGSRVIMVTTGESPYEEYAEEVITHALPAWRNWRFPVEVITIKYKEKQWQHIERTHEEGRKIGEELARQEIQAKITEGAKVLAEKVKILPAEEGAEKVRLEVETYEDLAVYANP